MHPKHHSHHNHLFPYERWYPFSSAWFKKTRKKLRGIGIGPTPTQLWSSSPESIFELIEQNNRFTDELQHIKEAYVEMKEKFDEVLVFQQEFVSIRDVQ